MSWIRTLVTTCLLSCALLSAAVVSAAPKDSKAQKALKEAMEDDYLLTNFDDAEAKLRGALETCGASGCSKSVKSKLYVGLGIVLAGGKKDKAGGTDAFKEALKLDSNATPDPDYVTSEVKAAFEAAKKGGGSSGSSGSPGGDSGSGGSKPANSEDSPITLNELSEQKVNTPVPVYVGVEDDSVKVASVTVTYIPVGSSSSKKLELEKSGRGFRGNIPCASVAKKGSLKFWVTAKDKGGKVVGSLGSDSDPYTTAIKSDVDGKPPSWPGFAPPEACAGTSEDGGGDNGESGATRRQCTEDKDCPGDEKCANFECLKKPTEGGDSGSEPEGGDTGSDDDGPSSDRLNWIRITFAPDFAMISGESICGFQDAYADGGPSVANDATYVCIKNPTSENPSRYLGQATAGQGNNVNFGFGVATMRILASYDRVVWKGLSLGARLGFVFNGTYEDFASFIPFHGEGRITYTIGSEPWSGKQVVRPWFFVGGGFAQVDASVNVDVLEDGEACGAENPGDTTSACSIESADGVLEPRIQTLRAVKQAGLGFAGGGAGISFVPADLFEINLGLKFSVTFPFVMPVLSPEAGIGFGF